MDIQESRTWIIFYLISFVMLLFALFLTTEGILLGIGLTMVIIVVGLNFYFLLQQLKVVSRRKEFMRSLSIPDDKADLEGEDS